MSSLFIPANSSSLYLNTLSQARARRTRPLSWVRRASAWVIWLGIVQAPVWAQDANAQLKAYATAAKSTPSAQAGEKFFNAKHGADWSCASCHGTPPTGQGKHMVTSKPIAPMAPAFNPERFTDTAKSDKWFRRNCKDVLSRECTDGEKADVLAYLLSLKK